MADRTVLHRCGGCGKKQPFVNTGKFRVNANGSRLDVWLIFRCSKCKHSWNLTVYERRRNMRNFWKTTGTSHAGTAATRPFSGATTQKSSKPVAFAPGFRLSKKDVGLF